MLPKHSREMAISDVVAVILAGGLATRLRPITEKIPKALVEVSGRPFIDHQLELLASHGIRHVVLCLGYLGQQVEAHVGNGEQFGLKVQYSHDGDKLLGTGGALRRALPLVRQHCWVMYGDSYMPIDYPSVLLRFVSQPVQGLMTVLRNDNQWDKSNVVFRAGTLQFYSKHQTAPEMSYIDYGVSLLSSEAITRMPLNMPYDLADLYSELVSERQMIGYEVFDRFYEIGTPKGLAETEIYLRRSAA